MKYSRKFTTKWHDTDANRIVTASKILMYMQETGNLQCKDYGNPLDEMRDEKGQGFILGSISMKVYKPLYAYEDIEVFTWCKEARGFSFIRYFEIYRDGELVAKASSLWALVDINTKSLVRGDASMDKFYPIDEPMDESDLPKRARIKRDAVLTKIGERKIAFSDLDYNMHMNNTKYPDMVLDFLPDRENSYISEIALSYAKEAAYGDTMSIKLGGVDENGYIEVVTENSAGERCLECKVKMSAAR
jgi:acyl-ACP thioesterase